MSNYIKITPDKGKVGISILFQLWEFRDLFYVLALKDLKIRYKQTVLGVGWVVFQPIFSAIIFTFLFGRLSNFTSHQLPYPIFAYVGLMFWTFFSNSITTISNSLIGSEGIIKKVYFPRMIIPLSTIVANTVDFLVSFILLLILLSIFRVGVSPIGLVLIPISFFLVVLHVIGIGLFLSALNVKFRDVRFIVPFFIQLLIFLTPVFYPLSIVSSQNRWILALNPMSTAIELSRGALIGKFILEPSILVSISIAIVSLFVGVYFFKANENSFSDII